MRKALIYLLLTILTSGWTLDLNLPLSSELVASSGLCLLVESPLTVLSNTSRAYPGLASSTSRLFDINELLLWSGAIGIPWRQFRFSAGCSSLLHPLWQETKITAAVSYSFKQVKAGCGINYIMNNVKGYHQGETLTYDLALLFTQKRLQTTVSIKNFTQTRFYDQELPVYFIGETAYKIDDKIVLDIGFEKELDFDYSLKIGTSYHPFSFLQIISSYQYQPDRIAGGFVLRIAKMRVSLSIRTHRYLGLTEAISLQYDL